MRTPPNFGKTPALRGYDYLEVLIGLRVPLNKLNYHVYQRSYACKEHFDICVCI